MDSGLPLWPCFLPCCWAVATGSQVGQSDFFEWEFSIGHLDFFQSRRQKSEKKDGHSKDFNSRFYCNQLSK